MLIMQYLEGTAHAIQYDNTRIHKKELWASSTYQL